MTSAGEPGSTGAPPPRDRSRRPEAGPVAAVLVAAALFGTTGTAKALGPDGATPAAVGALRIAVGAVSLWVLAARSPDTRPARGSGRASAVGAGASTAADGARRRAERAGAWPWLVVGGAGVAAYQPTFFTGTERSGVALGTIVALGSAPLFAGGLDTVVFGRRPGRAWAQAMAVALAGMVVLVAAQGGAATLDAVGIGCSLGAGVSYAVYAVAGKVLIVGGAPSTMAMASMFSVGAALLVPVLVTQPLGWVITGPGLAMLAHLGIVTVGLAYALYGFGLRVLATATVVLLTLAEPVTAAVAGVVVLGERLTAWACLGAAIVLVGLAMAAGVTSGGAPPASRSPRRAPPPSRAARPTGPHPR